MPTQPTKKISSSAGLAVLLTPPKKSENQSSTGIIRVTDIDTANKPATSSLSDYTIKPIKDFAEAVRKGDPKAVLTLLTALTALKYIASQQSITAAGLAAGQVATIGALLGPQGVAILGLIATAGVAMKGAQFAMNCFKQPQSVQLVNVDPNPDEVAAFTRSVRNGAIIAGASVGTYAGRRIQIEGEARFEAGLQASNLSPNAKKAVRAASVALPVTVGAAATYGVLTHVVDVTPQSAAAIAGTLGVAELGRRGYNYYTQMQSEAVRAAIDERAEALKQETTTPVWEMTTGVLYDTAGTCVDMTSNGLLQNGLGTVPALAIRTAGHTLAERHSLKQRGQEPDVTSGIFSSLRSNFMSYLTA